MKKQNGAVLIVSMILLFVLTLLATATMGTANMQVQMATNYQSSHQAFAWAENGLAAGRSDLVADFDGAALGDTDTLTMDGHTYTWEIIQEYGEADMGPGQTGFMIQSVGTFSMARRTVNAIFSKIVRPTALASALSLHPAGSVTVKGNSTISGYNHDVPTDFDCNGSGCAGSLNGADDTIGIYSDTDVGDLTEVGSTTIEGAPSTQNGGGSCDQDCWAGWAANIAQLATVHNGVNGDGAINWGTRADPIIHVIDQNMLINGNLDGAGILIISDSMVTINGNFHFEGLILAVGDGVDLTIGGTARLFGAVVAAGPNVEIDVGATGTPGIFYSLEALNNLDSLPTMRRLAWFEEMN